MANAEYMLERPLRTVLDVGCGEGAWRAQTLGEPIGLIWRQRGRLVAGNRIHRVLFTDC